MLLLAGWYPNEDNPVAGVFIRDQALALRDACDVAVLYVHFGGTERKVQCDSEEGMTVVRVTQPLGTASARTVRRFQYLFARTAGYARSLLAAYRRLVQVWGRPDIVHAHVFYPAGVGAWLLSAVHRLPHIVTEHSSEYLPEDGRFLSRRRRVTRFMMRRAGRNAARVVAVSTALGRALQDCGMCATFEVVPNVVRDCAVSRTRDPSPTKRIAHISLIDDASKNISGLLEAVSALRDKRDDFELHVAGDGADRAKLERLASERGLLGSTVFFLGSLDPDEVVDFLAASSFLVVSSRFETFSVAAAEALMCGRPVLSTRCGGPEDYVTEDLGMLVDANDVQALETGLDHMLDHFADYDAPHLHQRAYSMFSSAVVTSRLLAIYGDVLERSFWARR